MTPRGNALAPTVQHLATSLVVLNGFVVASDFARTTTTRSAATSTASRPVGLDRWTLPKGETVLKNSLPPIARETEEEWNGKRLARER